MLATARLITPPCSVTRSVDYDIGCKLRSLCNHDSDPTVGAKRLMPGEILPNARTNSRRQTLRSPQCLPSVIYCSG